MRHFNKINRAIISALVMVFAIFITTLHSCNPFTQTDSTYSLTGRMLKDCSGEPYKNYSLTFYIPANLGQKKIVLGTVSTDEKGYFKLSNIPSNRNDNINLKHTIDDNYVTTWGDFTIPDSVNVYDDGAVYDLGNYYETYHVNTIIKIIKASNWTQSDSIFVGYHLTNYQIFPPNSHQIVYQHSLNGSYYRAANVKPEIHLHWGVGKAFWDSLYTPNSGIEIDDYTIIAKQSVCTYPDTTYYNIP